jgi:asparagine synthase (glutamine-hydrolysing)
MCGIAGLMTSTGAAPDAAVLARLQAALAHRGPDGRATYVVNDTGMVHTRLAVLDLVTGDQPIREPGGAAIVANAEIYNYVELNARLHNVRLQTRSDCESPLHLFRRHGLDFVESLRGMYALAIHDPQSGRLVLARDPFGIKPLYCAATPAGFAFASEAQALIAAGLVEPRIRRSRAVELLQLKFTTGRETIFEGIERVLPGETLVVAGGRIVERRRLEAVPSGPPIVIGEDEALARLDAALHDSVAVHQRSDVPYGLFLSGGIDSSAVLALMAELNDRPVRAFTVGFSGTSVADERPRAREVARALGAEHVEVEFGEGDFWRLLPEIVGAMDDPAADYAILPTYKLAREAVERDVKVVLSGEGGDEMFAGYGRYRSVLRPWWLGGRIMRVRGHLSRLAILREEDAGWRDGIAGRESVEARPGRTPLQVAQAVDIGDWLPCDLLTKLDRCLMAHGVEGRTPFLDPIVAAVAFTLPDELKVRNRSGKWLLRKWLSAKAPAAQPFARKRGFTVPVGNWIAAQGVRLGPLVAAQPGVAELCRREAVERAFLGARSRRLGFAAWSLLFYALWHSRHVLRRPAVPDVFESLAAART